MTARIAILVPHLRFSPSPTQKLAFTRLSISLNILLGVCTHRSIHASQILDHKSEAIKFAELLKERRPSSRYQCVPWAVFPYLVADSWMACLISITEPVKIAGEKWHQPYPDGLEIVAYRYRAIGHDHLERGILRP